MYILIVDDEIALCDLFATVLQDENYSVVCAHNGRQALDFLRRHAERPALILLDLMMPVMNGWEFLFTRREDPALAAIPVIAMSASMVYADTAPVLGADAFLAKPVPLDMLVNLVARFTREALVVRQSSSEG